MKGDMNISYNQSGERERERGEEYKIIIETEKNADMKEKYR